MLTLDIEAGVKMAMEHLVGLGHRQIGFVSAEPYAFTETESASGYGHTHWAVKGYKDACKQYGLPVICEQIASIESPGCPLLAGVANRDESLATCYHRILKQLDNRMPHISL